MLRVVNNGFEAKSSLSRLEIAGVHYVALQIFDIKEPELQVDGGMMGLLTTRRYSIDDEGEPMEDTERLELSHFYVTEYGRLIVVFMDEDEEENEYEVMI